MLQRRLRFTSFLTSTIFECLPKQIWFAEVLIAELARITATSKSASQANKNQFSESLKTPFIL